MLGTPCRIQPDSWENFQNTMHQVRAKAESDRLSGRLASEEHKLSVALDRLQRAEHSARMLETAAGAARQRAEASARKVAERESVR